MRNETIQPTDRPTQVLRSLDSKEFCLKIITTNKDKDTILQGLRHDMSDFTSLEKTSLVIGIFTILSKLDPGGEKQHQRTAGLDVLSLVDLTSLTTQESNSIAMHYVETVSQMDADHDPLGEIDAFLEAGKIIAPFISNFRLYLSRRWRTVASRFTGDEREHILNKREEIKQRMPSRPNEFDQQVEGLAKQGAFNKDIAKMLQTTPIEVNRAIHRLYKKDISLSRPKGRQLNEQEQQDYLRVKELRNTGIGNTEIARQLNLPTSRLNYMVRVLSQKGEIELLKRGRRKKQE